MATVNVAGTQSGTAGLKGITAQYQKTGTAGGDQSNTNITPAGPYISKGTNNNIIGTVPPGKAGIRQISTVIQNSLDPLVDGALANSQADNFAAATTAQVASSVVPGAGAGGNVTPNAAQLDSAGKSMSPQTE